ncbi:MAG: electron transfer flavoprotein-ubiquinone oxidoreductase [Bdellovibrio sp.]|nr:MAG: electron transfer flavoprotein-ubiquinone oxidoreductase [Bdellovibrio sp.]
MMPLSQFKPSDYQLPLDLQKFIASYEGPSDEEVPLDVLFVGAGPAGLIGAISLAQKAKAAGKELEIGVLEKAESIGGHSISGAIINPVVLKQVFPEEKNFPFRNLIKGEQVLFLTDNGKFPVPTPPTMHNKGLYSASLCEVVQWLGKKAEELGINLLTGFPAHQLLMDGDQVKGVRTTPSGLNKDGSLSNQVMPPTNITAQYTVLCDGSRGLLTQVYLEHQKISSPLPQIYALGVKEVWKTPHPPQKVYHTMGWPLPSDAFGGSFLYPMGKDMLSIGLVVGLDYKPHNLDVHYLLQKMKTHPFFKPFLDGGELLEWGAKTIPEGGYHSLPETLTGPGILIAGDAAGFVNVPALKGIHYAMESGRLAAQAIFKAIESNTPNAIDEYNQLLKDSFIYKDLYKVRNMRQAFKDGLYKGGFKAALMTLTNGAFPSSTPKVLPDAEEPKFINPKPFVEEQGIKKVDAVYQSANKTRDDIPPHLSAKKDIPKEVAEFYTHMCPAGVYEVNESGELVINAPNCVDCKATDILGPRWEPREGGSGPNYRFM